MLKELTLSALLIATASAACWSESLGYPCCSSPNVPVISTDGSGKWGIENNNWCGIPVEEKTDCWAQKLGYQCCTPGTAPTYKDEYGDWGFENGDWCGIVSLPKPKPVQTCWAEKLGYQCCSSGASSIYNDEYGAWGYENGDWCGIIAGGAGAGTTKVNVTTDRRTTTTTTTRKVKPTYSVIYEAGTRLNSGYENWGWDSAVSFKEASMVIKADPNSYGAASIKNLKGDYGRGGSIRLDIKSKGKVFIKVESTADEEVSQVGTTSGDNDFKTYKFDINYDGYFDRISIQDGAGNGDPIYVRYLIYSTGSAADFVDPVDTSYIPVVTTRKPVTRAVYTTIFRTVSSLPNGYENWGWGCRVSYSGGAMVITPESGEYGAVSLKKVSGTFNGGSLRFDLKSEGKVNVMVESTDRDEKLTVAVINASDSFQTYIVDVDFGTFDRINFQDAKGTGDRIWVKNLVHSTGYADDFVDPI